MTFLKKEQLKVFIANTAFCANNKGVEALTKASIDIIKKCFPNAEIVVWQTPPEGMDISTDYIQRQGDITLYKEKSIASFLTKAAFYVLLLAMGTRHLKIEHGLLYDVTSSDIIINLNYGDLFTDAYYGRRIWCLLVLSNIILLLSRRPIVLFPQSIGPFKGRFSRVIAAKLLKSSATIMVREKYSKEMLIRTLGIDGDKILSVLDVAFLLNPAPDQRIEEILRTQKMPKDSPRPFVGFIMNPYLREKTFRTILSLARFVEKKFNGTIILIPHNVSGNKTCDGGAFNSLIENELRRSGCRNIFSFVGNYSAEETKGLIGLCNAIVAYPTHAAIAALSQGKPTIAFSYSHKTAGLFENFGLGKYVTSLSNSLSAKAEQRLANLLKELIENESLIKKRTLEKLAENVSMMSESIEDVLKTIVRNCHRMELARKTN